MSINYSLYKWIWRTTITASLALAFSAYPAVAVTASAPADSQQNSKGSVQLSSKPSTLPKGNIRLASVEKAQVTVQKVAQVAEEQPKTLMTQPTLELNLPIGGSDVINGVGITRASVSNPAIADIVPVSKTEVLVNAKVDGTATIRVWDDNGLTTYQLTVNKPAQTKDELIADIAKQIGVPLVTVKMAEDTIILEGTVPTNDISTKAGNIAGAFGKKVLNLIVVEAVSSEKLISSLKAAMPNENLTYDQLADGTLLIRGSVASNEEAAVIQDIVQTWVGDTGPADGKTSLAASPSAETEGATDVLMAKTQARENQPGEVTVGDEFLYTRKVFGGRIPNGPRVVVNVEVNPSLARQILVSAVILEINRGKLKQLGIDWASFVGGTAQPLFKVLENRVSPVSLDNVGPMARTTVSADLRALIDENAARVISEPKLLISDGHPANILVGGEFPIPVAQTNNGGGSSITIAFKTFGIQLAVRPRAMPDGRVLLVLTSEFSTLDFANGVKTADITIPAINVRRATTTVHMADKQTLAIGGLVTKEDISTITRIPLLSKIPLLGELFKSTRFQKSETELVILVTPEVIDNNALPAIPRPE